MISAATLEFVTIVGGPRIPHAGKTGIVIGHGKNETGPYVEVQFADGMTEKYLRAFLRITGCGVA